MSALPPNMREIVDNTTTGVAALSITSPIWLTWLKTTSEISAYAAPILGAVWLVVQIWAKIKTTLERKSE